MIKLTYLKKKKKAKRRWGYYKGGGKKQRKRFYYDTEDQAMIIIVEEWEATKRKTHGKQIYGERTKSQRRIKVISEKTYFI